MDQEAIELETKRLVKRLRDMAELVEQSIPHGGVHSSIGYALTWRGATVQIAIDLTTDQFIIWTDYVHERGGAE